MWILKIHLHLSNIIRKGGGKTAISWDDLTQWHVFLGPPCLAGGTRFSYSVINNCLVQCCVWNKASFIFFFKLLAQENSLMGNGYCVYCYLMMKCHLTKIFL